MITFDFSSARLAHTTWRLKLRSFLDGKKNLSETELISHLDCKLGKWLYSKGLAKYGEIPNMQKLEEVHIELHATTKQIMKMHLAGNTRDAEKEYRKLEQLSEEIVSLLNFMEQAIK